jgi:hypothetical protein
MPAFAPINAWQGKCTAQQMQENSLVSFSGVFALRDRVSEAEFLPRLQATGWFSAAARCGHWADVQIGRIQRRAWSVFCA